MHTGISCKSNGAVNCINRSLHPLLHDLSLKAEWTKEGAYPAWSQWADEHEKWLKFADEKGELSRFLPRLQESAYQRDRTLAELGWAYYPKFTDSTPNVLLIWDDYFVALDPLSANIALYAPQAGAHKTRYLAENGYFVDFRYERLGAVGILRVNSSGGHITYNNTTRRAI